MLLPPLLELAIHGTPEPVHHPRTAIGDERHGARLARLETQPWLSRGQAGDTGMTDDDAVVWHCPACGTEGHISNWQGTVWDLSHGMPSD